MSISDQSVQENVERAPWWLVAVLVVGITLFFGSSYFMLTLYSPVNGLKAEPKEPMSFLTCVYFSLVTETTLGDGSITPHGAARGIAGLQVLLGLIIAGILVAKIVSAPSGAVARLSTMAEGDWVDCVVAHGKGTRIIGRTWIQTEHNGVSFQGMDHLPEGIRVDSFIAHSLAVSTNKASFAYQCFDYSTRVLDSGVSTLSFHGNRNGRYTSYAISITDSAGRMYSGRGVRLDDTPLQNELTRRDECPAESIKLLARMFDQKSN